MSRITALTCVALLLVVLPASAQRRAPGASRPTVGVTIALKAGADTYQFTGPASCTHAATGSIYGILSELWSVQHADAARSAQLTLWKPKNGSAEMFTLSLSAGSRSYSVNTVKATGAPAAQGSGTVTLAPAANGGTFTIEARTGDGTTISGTVKCDAFLPAVAEGGH